MVDVMQFILVIVGSALAEMSTFTEWSLLLGIPDCSLSMRLVPLVGAGFSADGVPASSA